MPKVRVSASAATVALIVIGTGLRLLAAGAVGLGVSESYYFGAARHPSLSYFDHPPAAAWLAWASMHLTGELSGLILRLPFIALFGMTTWLMFLIGRRLFSDWAGFLSALLLNLTPVFALSAGMFLQPDGPLMCFWLATLYVLAPSMVTEVVPTTPGRRWIIAGAMLGLTLLSKYTAVFLVSGVALWLLTDPVRRRWFLRPEPYLALAIALVVFTPVLLWNAGHDWISFRWQVSRGTTYYGIHLPWLLKNIGGQIAEVSPWVWTLLILEPFRALPATPQAQARRFLLCVGLPPIVAYTVVAAYADVGNHFHWGTPGYLTLLIGLGATVAGWFERRPRVAMATVVAVAVASVSVMVLAHVQAATGRFSVGYGAVSEALAGGDDPTIEMIDYDELHHDFASRGWLDRTDLFVFSDRHYVGGKVDYALKGRLPFLLLNREDPREYAFFESPARWVGREGILVSHRSELAEVQFDYGEFCSAIEPLDPVPVRRNGVVEVTLYLFRCAQLIKPFPLPYGQ